MDFDKYTMEQRIDYLIYVLNLRRKSDNKYLTNWGKKTQEGLRDTIKNILCLERLEKLEQQEINKNLNIKWITNE